jgi:hypothetical protein
MQAVKKVYTSYRDVNVELVKMKNLANSAYTQLAAKNKETADAGLAIKQRLEDQQKELRRVAQETKTAAKEAGRFKGEWLSVMFFGMAIQRAFGGFLRAASQTFNRVTEGTAQANNGLTQMSAAWEFFKYSFMETLLNSALFEHIVKFALMLVEKWGDLSDKTKELVADVVLFAAALGTAMATAGIIKLGMAGQATVLGEADNLLYNLKSVLGLVLIFVAFKAATDAYDEFKNGNFFSAAIDAIKAGAIAAGLVYKSPALIAVGVALVIADTPAFNNSMKVVASYIVAYFQTVGELAGNVFSQSFVDIMKSMLYGWLINVADMVSRIPLFNSLANKIRALAEDIQGSTSIGMRGVDFAGIFDKNLKENLKTLEIGRASCRERV